MVTVGAVILLAAVGLSPTVVVLSVQFGNPSSRLRWFGRSSWVAVALCGAAGIVSSGASGQLNAPGAFRFASLVVSPLSIVLVALFNTVGGVLGSYSSRYLQGDGQADSFLRSATVVIAAMGVVAAAGSLQLLIVAWIVAGLGFVRTLAYRADLARARTGAWRLLGTLGIADLPLLVAGFYLTAQHGVIGLANPQWGSLLVGQLGSVAVALIALAIAAAALARSAQFPFHRWLPGTLEAPTPTSALLHAGVVNGGGILLLRLAPFDATSRIAMIVLLVSASLGAIYGSLVARRRVDYKGGLVFSTMAQMGFMVAEIAVGAYLAALAHLIGHALYKAHLFLSSGTPITRPGVRLRRRGVPVRSVQAGLVAGLMALVATGIFAVMPGARSHRGALVLLVFVAAAAFAVNERWWRSATLAPRVALLWIGLMVLWAAGYGLATGLLDGWIGSLVPTDHQGLIPVATLVIIALGILGAELAGRYPPGQRLLASMGRNSVRIRSAVPTSGWHGRRSDRLEVMPSLRAVVHQ
jgi:NADH:ubiquinone oxidoreductase subunit 5 (subunit L)/multisubunit Na+/H+ antiporter MnhA subunit